VVVVVIVLFDWIKIPMLRKYMQYTKQSNTISQSKPTAANYLYTSTAPYFGFLCLYEVQLPTRAKIVLLVEKYEYLTTILYRKPKNTAHPPAPCAAYLHCLLLSISYPQLWFCVVEQ